jgi:hypothetical protein
LVAPGSYAGDGNRDIDFRGKEIVLTSQNGAEGTIIDCDASADDRHRAFHFHSGETQSSVVDGFTITGGYAPSVPYFFPSGGGGIFCNNESSPTIRKCVITGNSALVGAGICILNSGPVLQNTIIRANVGVMIHMIDLGSLGAGIYCANSDAVVAECIIDLNSVIYDVHGGEGGYGAAIYFRDSSNVVVSNTTITRNYAHNYWFPRSVVTARDSCNIILENCILGHNDGMSIEALFEDTTVAFDLTCCDIFGNNHGDWIESISDQADINGNMCANPLFCDTSAYDYSIGVASPCASENNECAQLIGALGIECHFCGDADKSGGVDIDDVVCVVGFIFGEGPAPEPFESGDADCSSIIDIDDVVYLINYIFNGGNAPCDSDGDGETDC